MGRKREGARRFRPLELLRLEEAEKRERERSGCHLEISTYFPFLPHHFFSFFFLFLVTDLEKWLGLSIPKERGESACLLYWHFSPSWPPSPCTLLKESHST